MNFNRDHDAYGDETIDICVFCDEEYKEKYVKRLGTNIFPEGTNFFLKTFPVKQFRTRRRGGFRRGRRGGKRRGGKRGRNR